VLIDRDCATLSTKAGDAVAVLPGPLYIMPFILPAEKAGDLDMHSPQKVISMS